MRLQSNNSTSSPSSILVSLFLAANLALFSALPAVSAEQFIKLTQQSCTRGKMIVYVSPKAVFVDCVARGYCVVCKAPDWKVTMYSPKSKRFYEETASTWKNRAQVNFMDLLAARMSGMKVQKVQQETFLRHKVTLLRMKQDFVSHLRDYGVSHKTEYGSYYICNDFNLPAQCSDFMVWFFKLPPVAPAQGIPLKFFHIDSSQSTYNRLNTLAIEPAEVDSKRLTVPPGYERTGSETIMLLDKSNEGALEELWDVRTPSLRSSDGAKKKP
jgi:hypothetical protein